MHREGLGIANSSKSCWPAAEQDVCRWLLLCILIIATAYRVYGIDSYSLWGTELSDAIAVSHTGWLDMVSAMRYGDIRPPGYHTVLYVFSQLLGRSEFVLRLPSMVAGIASVYLVFRLGARIASPFVGLLGAVILSGSYHAISYSQEAQASSLLMALCLANFLCLLNIIHGTCEIPAGQDDPAAGCSSVQLAGFWLTGIALAHQHYAGMSIVFVELLLCLFIAIRTKHGPWRELLRAAFWPVGLSVALWLPSMVTHAQKIWPLTTLVRPSDGDLDALKVMLLGAASPLRFFTVAGLAGFLCWMYACARKGSGSCSISLLAVTAVFACLLLGLLSAMTFLVPFSANPGLFMVLQPFLALLSACGVFYVARGIFSPHTMLALLLVLVCATAAFQFNANREAGLFAAGSKRDIRMGMRLLAQDKAFMLSSGRTVFTSTPLLSYYLERYEIRRPEDKRYAVIARREGDVAKVADAFREEDFYYLDTNVVKISPLLKALSRQYRELCQSMVGGMRLVKFSRVQPVANNGEKQECVMAAVVVNGSEDK